MNINFAFRGFDENSDGLKDYASKRLNKVTKLVSANTYIEVVFQKDKNNKFTEIKLNHDGDDYVATDTNEKDFSTSIDLCVDKIAKQILKTKDRKVHARRA